MSRRAASCPVSRMACGCVRCATGASQLSTMRCVRLAWWSSDSTIGVSGELHDLFGVARTAGPIVRHLTEYE